MAVTPNTRRRNISWTSFAQCRIRYVLRAPRTIQRYQLVVLGVPASVKKQLISVLERYITVVASVDRLEWTVVLDVLLVDFHRQELSVARVTSVAFLTRDVEVVAVVGTGYPHLTLKQGIVLLH